MPTTNSLNLTLDRNGQNVTVTVTYNAVFSAFERNLVGLGMVYTERIAVIGVDPPGSNTGTVLRQFARQAIPVPPGAGALSVPRSRSIIMSRAQLDEDSNNFLPPDIDADEIKCRIRIEATAFPPAVTPDAFTDQEVLGLILQPFNAVAAGD